MRRLSNVLFFSLFFLLIPMMSFASTYTFSDDFNDSGIDGWTGKIGAWSNPDGTSLQSSTNVYSVIWKDGSNQGGLYQSITVDAYFDFTNSFTFDNYAHLRLRTGSIWDSGYLAQFSKNGVSVQNTYLGSNPVIGSFTFGGGLSSGWHTLRFDVSGTGADTNLQLWVEGIRYLNVDYNDIGDANGNNDNGYIGLGRLIQYDNASGYSSDTPVPEPATMALLGFGLLGLAGVSRKKINK